MTRDPHELRAIVTYPRDAILEACHVAAALGVSEEIINKMDLPCFLAGTRLRFLWGQVLDELAARAFAVTDEERRRARHR